MPQQTGSYDLSAAKKASQTADDYITEISNDGVFVHTSGDSSTSTGSGVHIGASAINIIKSGVSYIKAWISNNIPYIRIGREDKGNVLIDNDSVDIRDGTTVSASFGANNIVLGNPTNSPHVSVTPNNMAFYDADQTSSAASIEYSIQNDAKRFTIRADKTTTDFAGVGMRAAEGSGNSWVQIGASNATDDTDYPTDEVYMTVSAKGVNVSFNGAHTASMPLKIYDSTEKENIFEVDTFGFCTAATDGLLYSGEDALALFDVTTGTIASLAMYRYGKVIQLNVAFKNTSSVASNSNVLEATWAPGWTDDIKPINSVNGSSFYGKTPLPGSFTASNGRLVVHNASTAAVTVSSNTLITFTYIAANAL